MSKVAWAARLQARTDKAKEIKNVKKAEEKAEQQERVSTAKQKVKHDKFAAGKATRKEKRDAKHVEEITADVEDGLFDEEPAAVEAAPDE